MIPHHWRWDEPRFWENILAVATKYRDDEGWRLAYRKRRARRNWPDPFIGRQWSK